MKSVKGFYILIIKQFDDTMFGADYHYTTWCIADNKFCRFNRTNKLKKFSTYDEAMQYAIHDEKYNSHTRKLEICYLTTASWQDNENIDKNLVNWVQITSEEDAIEYDRCQKNPTELLSNSNKNDVHFWDSTQFDSIFNVELFN